MVHFCFEGSFVTSSGSIVFQNLAMGLRFGKARRKKGRLDIYSLMKFKEGHVLTNRHVGETV